MIIFLEEVCMQLFLWLLQLTDGIQELFGALAGIDDVAYGDADVNIIETTITSQTVSTVFWCILVLAVGLACIFTIVAVIKNMITTKRTLSSIVGKFFLAILGTVAMLLVVMLGIMIANMTLRILSDIFSLSTGMKISSLIFNACVGQWSNGFTIKDFDVSTTTVADILGSYDTAMWVWPTSWKGNGMIDPGSFYYLPSLIAGFIMIYNMFGALFGLAKRVFEIVYCYFCMPLAMSTLPLDEGARFRNWSELFISRIILAFGTVLSVNIFALLLPVLMNMTIPGAGSFENAIFMIILLAGGALSISGGQMLFVRIFGRAEDVQPNRVMHTVTHLGNMALGAVTGFTANAVISTIDAGRAGYKYLKGRAQSSRSGDTGDGGYGDGDGGDDSDTYTDDDPFSDDSGIYTDDDGGGAFA